MLYRVTWGQYNPDTLYKRLLRLQGQRIYVATAESSYVGQLVEILPDHIRLTPETTPNAVIFIPLFQIVTVLEPVPAPPAAAAYHMAPMTPYVSGWQYLGRRLFELIGQVVGFELAGTVDQGGITCGRILEVACDYVLIEGGTLDNVNYNAVIPLQKIQSVQLGLCPEPGAPIPAQALQRKKKK
jgi:hypothetical protein